MKIDCRMKILIVSQYFWPETFRINDLVIELVKRGYDVEILTGKPNYPSGKFFKGYHFFSRHNETLHGARIHRVPLMPRGSGSGVRLAMNYLSFVFFASLHILFKPKKYDITITFAISPITQVFPALLHKRLMKSKSLLWLQDLWPESVSAASGIESEFVINLLEKMVRYIYKRTDKIMIQSESFKENVLKYSDDSTKIEYLPNWAEDLYLDSQVDTTKYRSLLPDGFKIVFAGNIGESQDFESILHAARQLNHINKNIKFVIVGDGRKKSWVENEIQKYHLQETVFLVGRFPIEEMPHFFVHADLMLMTLMNKHIFSLTIPSKIQSYMAFGKPIIGMLNGIGNQIIQDAQCGYACEAGDYNQLCADILLAYNAEKQILENYGQNARVYYEEYFSKRKVVDHLVSLF